MKILHCFPCGHRSSLPPYSDRKSKKSSFLATLTTQISLLTFFSRQPAQGKTSINSKVRYISANPFWRGFLCQMRQWMNRSKRGDFMHEVKVYDISGKLKRVISVQELNIRSQEQMDSPFLFRKNKTVRRPAVKSPNNMKGTKK